MTNEELIFTFKTLLRSKETLPMKAAIKRSHPADIGEALAHFSPQEVATLISLTPKKRRALVFGYMDHALQREVVEALEKPALVELVTHMPHDERVDLFQQLGEERQKVLMPALAKAEQEDIRKLTAYEEGTVGSIMTSDYAVLRSELTAQEAINHLRMVAPDRETIYQTFVINGDHQLLGTVSLKDLILAEPDTKVSDIMTLEPPFIRADAPDEEAAQLIAKYDLLALPVINGGEKLVGIVTHDDAMDVSKAEADEDFHRMGAVGDLSEPAHKGTVSALAVSMKDATISLLYRKRVFWLVLLVFGNIFSGAGIAYFEDTIAAYIALVFFLPLLVDSGGNAGSQSATLMVRALATGDVRLKDWGSMLGRELVVAGLLGATMAVAVSLLGIWRGGMEIALVVALTMQIVVIVGSVIGMSLPFLLSRLRLDPASASAPLITSIADAAGVVIYFAMATWILDIPAAL